MNNNSQAGKREIQRICAIFVDLAFGVFKWGRLHQE